MKICIEVGKKINKQKMIDLKKERKISGCTIKMCGGPRPGRQPVLLLHYLLRLLIVVKEVFVSYTLVCLNIHVIKTIRHEVKLQLTLYTLYMKPNVILSKQYTCYISIKRE